MSEPKINQRATDAPMPPASVPANPLALPSASAARALPGQAIDPSLCPIDHAVRGLAPDYLSAAPTDVTHLLDGRMNYEGFFPAPIARSPSGGELSGVLRSRTPRRRFPARHSLR